MKIIIEKVLEDFWATDADFATMTDSEIIGLVREDAWALIEGADFTVERKSPEFYAHDSGKDQEK